MGGYDEKKSYPIYVHGKKDNGQDDYTNQFTIDWDDRFDKKQLEKIGRGCFFTARRRR